MRSKAASMLDRMDAVTILLSLMKQVYREPGKGLSKLDRAVRYINSTMTS